MIPDTALLDPTMNTDQSQTATQSHPCNLCCASFPTFKQLRIHETTKHNIRCMATLLTPTNCCPNCNTIFASRASAIHHLKNAMSKGYCNSHRAHNLQQLIPPTNLQCAYCMALGNENELMHEETERLHQHIKTSHLFDLPIRSQHVGQKMPVWVKQNRENGPDVHGRRKKEKGREKKKMKILVINRLTKLRTAHITKDRET